MTKEKIHEKLISWSSDIEVMMLGRLDAMCKDSHDKTLEEFRDKLRKINGAMKLMREQIETEGIMR